MAAVDHELRVHGLSALRVADGSITPSVVSGNANALDHGRQESHEDKGGEQL